MPGAGKDAWRRWLRLQRDPDPTVTSAALVRALHAVLADLPPSHIATFSPLPGEPDLLTAVDAHPQHTWHFPRVTGDDLDFHAVAHLSDLRSGAFDILEPPADSPSTLPETIDLFLCPGLGFGRDGTRLGRGKGYYDRTLARARPDARLIGVAFPCRIVETLPVDPHDIRMTSLLDPATG